MLIHCKICQREFDWNPQQKLRQQAWRGLCPDCIFLCKQQLQPDGPEKMILRILHEHLLKRHAVDEKRFIDWKSRQKLAPNVIPKFWSENIFGNFLEGWYSVTYICGGNKEQVIEFGKKLQAAFDEQSRCFLFDSRHLSFHIKETKIECPTDNPSIGMYYAMIKLKPNAT